MCVLYVAENSRVVGANAILMTLYFVNARVGTSSYTTCCTRRLESAWARARCIVLQCTQRTRTSAGGKIKKQTNAI